MSTHRFLVEPKQTEKVQEENCTRRPVSLVGISEKTPVLTYGRARAFLPDETGEAIICIEINPGIKSDWVTTILEKNFEITLTPVNPVGKRRSLHR